MVAPANLWHRVALSLYTCGLYEHFTFYLFSVAKLKRKLMWCFDGLDDRCNPIALLWLGKTYHLPLGEDAASVVVCWSDLIQRCNPFVVRYEEKFRPMCV